MLDKKIRSGLGLEDNLAGDQPIGDTSKRHSRFCDSDSSVPPPGRPKPPALSPLLLGLKPDPVRQKVAAYQRIRRVRARLVKTHQKMIEIIDQIEELRREEME